MIERHRLTLKGAEGRSATVIGTDGGMGAKTESVFACAGQVGGAPSVASVQSAGCAEAVSKHEVGGVHASDLGQGVRRPIKRKRRSRTMGPARSLTVAADILPLGIGTSQDNNVVNLSC